MTGPGPKDYAVEALEAVANAIEAPFVKAENVVVSVLEKAHADERAALEKMQAVEKEAAAALSNIKATIGEPVKVLSARFPSIVADFRAALSRL